MKMRLARILSLLELDYAIDPKIIVTAMVNEMRRQFAPVSEETLSLRIQLLDESTLRFVMELEGSE